uniref:Uncharacterized protein n=1 Tax=Oryza glumipatula TaxID=40148 RepID=A0A0E0BAU9_9ORYZ
MSMERYERTRDQDSGSEYDPLQDDTAGDISDGTATGSKRKGCSKTNNASDAPCGVKFRPRKRVYADQPPTRCTRSKKSTAQPDASLPASDNIPVPPPPPTIETVVNFAEHTQPAAEDNGGDAIAQSNGHIHMANEDDGDDANPQSDGHGHSHMVNEDGFHQHEDNTTMDDGDYQMTHEGAEGPWNRGPNMGRGLQRINRARRGKLPIIIPEGHIRPLTPIIAAKFATECNIAVRGHVPMFKHWKDYKSRPAAKFNINTDDPTVHNGCIEMMKSAIRQQRHRLKEDYFDPFPLHLVTKTSPVKSTSDEDWLKLVESWKTPKKMEACQKNKENRAQVKFPATTGSCSYPVFVENLNQMEQQLAAPPEEGEEPKSATEVVADVLDDSTKKNMFLQNVGIQTARPRSSVQNVQAQLEVEKMANVELRAKVDDLERKAYETEQARLRDMEEMQKKQADLEAKLELMLGQHRPLEDGMNWWDYIQNFHHQPGADVLMQDAPG